MASKRQLLLIEINFWILGPPLGGFFRILKKGLVKLIPLFAEVPDGFREVFGVLGKYPLKFMATGLAEILFIKSRILFLECGDNAIEEMIPHKLIIRDAVKRRTFHPVVGIQTVI